MSFFNTGSHNVVQADLELWASLLPQPPKVGELQVCTTIPSFPQSFLFNHTNFDKVRKHPNYFFHCHLLNEIKARAYFKHVPESNCKHEITFQLELLDDPHCVDYE